MRNHARTLALCTLAATAIALPAAAQAQETVGTPPGETAAHHGRAVGGSGGGLGIGAASYVSGMAGPQAVYDGGPWHAELMLGFEHHSAGGGPNPPGVTTFDLGLGGWYHLHAGDRSDFSVGGNLGFMVANTSPGGSANAIVIEPGVQVRVFVTDNVALSGRVGVPIVFGDGVGAPYVGELHEHFGLGGQLVGAFGFAYFFR